MKTLKPKKKIQLLEKLLEKSKEVTVESNSHPNFKRWKDLVEKRLIKVFGDDSIEVSEFKKLKFFNSPKISSIGDDQSSEHLRCFRRDFYTAKKLISSYIANSGNSELPIQG